MSGVIPPVHIPTWCLIEHMDKLTVAAIKQRLQTRKSVLREVFFGRLKTCHYSVRRPEAAVGIQIRRFELLTG